MRESHIADLPEVVVGALEVALLEEEVGGAAGGGAAEVDGGDAGDAVVMQLQVPDPFAEDVFLVVKERAGVESSQLPEYGFFDKQKGAAWHTDGERPALKERGVRQQHFLLAR